MKKNKSRLGFKPFVIIFILLIGLIIALQIFGASRFETILASEGEVIDGFWAKSLIIRDEKVVTAPITGTVTLDCSEGERIPAGTKVCVIESGEIAKKMYNRQAGLISYAVDGLESSLNSSQLNQIDLKKFADYQGNYKHLLSGRKIAAGEPLYRMINNFDLYLIIPARPVQAERFRNNELIFIQENDSTEMLKARVIKVENQLEQSYIFVELDSFIPRWLNIRRVNLNIIKNIYRGIKIPRQAVFNQPAGQGVLKVTGHNKYEFEKVVILEGNEKEVIVKGIGIGEEIIINPADFNYGREG